MSKFSLVVLFLLLRAGTGFAQNYFAFIGAGNRQPFYVRIDNEFHPSTAEGHLILSQLKDTTYSITIGFPGETLPEQHYSFAIRGRDQAFELRSQGQEGLRLFDLQGNEWLSPQGGGGLVDGPGAASIKKDDAFSRMMAGVVHDTAVLYNSYAMERALSDSPVVSASTKPADIPVVPPVSDTARSAPALRQDTVVALAPRTDTAVTVTSPRADTAVATVSPVTPAPFPDSTHAETTSVPVTPLKTPPAPTPVSTAPGTIIDTVVDIPRSKPADTTVYTAGVMTHDPPPRFNDSGSAPLYRPIPKDTMVKAAPIPSAVGAPLYRQVSGPVVKLSEKHGTKNVRLVYADHSGGTKADTIVVVIPMDSPIAKTAVHPTHAADSTHGPAARAHGPNADSPAIGASAAYRSAIPSPPASSKVPRPLPADTTGRPAKSTPFLNSDCHDFATDYDLDKLRLKMLESPKDDDRVAIARKTFKIKCFSTRQIRTLSEVFTSDAAKYRFFEAAWPFAADEHFQELSALLADPVYNSKFKTLTHQQ